MTTTSRIAAITLDYTAVQTGNHTLNFLDGNFDHCLRFPNLTDQLQPGKVGTDFRLLIVVRVAVGAVVKQFHDSDVTSFAAVNSAENVATVFVNLGLLFVDQKPCAFRNLRFKPIVRCEDHRAVDDCFWHCVFCSESGFQKYSL